MKTKTLFTIAGFCLLTNSAIAGTCTVYAQGDCNYSSSDSTIGCEEGNAHRYCIKASAIGSSAHGFLSCASCSPGYVRSCATFPGCDGTETNANNYCSCIKCKTTDWSSAPLTGNSTDAYQYRTVCEGTTEKKQYRCWPGHYSSTSIEVAYDYGQKSDSIFCPICPTYTVNGAHISAKTTPGSTAHIESCYIPTGTYSDDSGTFTITSKCSYSRN